MGLMGEKLARHKPHLCVRRGRKTCADREFKIPHSEVAFCAVIGSSFARGKLAVNLHSLPSMPQFWVICEGDSASSFVIAARIFCQKRIV
jgi:hypothetical protein